MRRGILFLCLLALGNLLVIAQTEAPTPQPPDRTRSGSRTSTSVMRESNASFERLRALELVQTKEKASGSSLLELGDTIYRKPSKEEIGNLRPAPHMLSKYAAFLRQPNTGIVKLNADSSCFQDTDVVVAKENCLQYLIPGAGTAFSFRIENYRLPHLADLVLSNDVLKTDGVLQQGVMVKIGDVPLESVTLETGGLKYLLDFKPAADLDAFMKNDRELADGVEADGFLYRLGFYVDDQSTFALRSIAYRGEVIRVVKGIRYNEMDFDKRKDIIVAFRVIDKDSAGNITLLWKILAKNNSPVLKVKQANSKDHGKK